MNTTRQTICNFIKAGKVLSNIEELTDKYHRSFDRYYKRPNHYHTATLAQFYGDTVTKGELVAALYEYEEDTEISINTHGDYDWGFNIQVTTEKEIPYTDEEWLQEIIQSDIKNIGMGLGEKSLVTELQHPSIKRCKDYDAMMVLARTLHNMKFEIEEFIALDNTVSAQTIITYRLLARLFVEMYSTEGDYLSNPHKHSKFFADLFGGAEPMHYPKLVRRYASSIM